MALYDNVTPSLVKEALGVAISELRPDWSGDFADWIMSLVDLTLESSFAKYGKSWYIGLKGIATGGSLSVSFANIAVYYALRKVIYEAVDRPMDCLGVVRFVDDMGGLWIGTVEDFIAWSEKVNSDLSKYGLSIKDGPDSIWDINKPGEFTVFLDVKYHFSVDGILNTDVNIKKTDARAYLHFNSSHPKNTFPSIIYSQCLRYHRIINDLSILKLRFKELEDYFIRSGYPKAMIQGGMNDVLSRKRSLEYKNKADTKPFPILWIQTYNAASDSIQSVINKTNRVLKSSETWVDTKRPIGLVHRRDKNLGDILEAINTKMEKLHNDMLHYIKKSD